MDENSLDDQLLKAVAEGDPAAIRTFIDATKAMVHVVAERVLGDLDADLVDDVAWAAMQRGITGIREGRFEQGKDGKCRIWLAVVTKNVALDARRKRAVLRRFENELWMASRAFLEGSDPADLLHRRQMLSVLELAIGQLPENFRAVVVRRLEDATDEEIADVLGVAVATVRTRWKRATKMLMEIVARESAGFGHGAHSKIAARRACR